MKNGNYTTKINWIVTCAIAIFILLSGCKKEPVLSPDTQVTATEPEQTIAVADPATQNLTSCHPDCENTVDLMAGQYTKVGTVHYKNNPNGFIDITYTVCSPWKIQSVSYYMGACEQIPKNPAGNTIPGQYPYKRTFSSPGVTVYTFSIPKQNVTTCGCIAAHAIVKNSSTGATETAWGKGTRFTNTNWAMYYPYCLTDCEQQNCAFPLPYWFHDLRINTIPNITIANRVYTRTELSDLWYYNSGETLADSRICFLQVATIKLSASHIDNNSSVWNDVAICENYLNSLNQKITLTYSPTGNHNARVAANRILAWVNANNCDN